MTIVSPQVGAISLWRCMLSGTFSRNDPKWICLALFITTPVLPKPKTSSRAGLPDAFRRVGEHQVDCGSIAALDKHGCCMHVLKQYLISYVVVIQEVLQSPSCPFGPPSNQLKAKKPNPESRPYHPLISEHAGRRLFSLFGYRPEVSVATFFRSRSVLPA